VYVKSGAGFMPLFSGSATPARARRLVEEHLLNDKEFLDQLSGGQLREDGAGLLPGLAQQGVQLARLDVGAVHYMIFEACGATASTTWPGNWPRGCSKWRW